MTRQPAAPFAIVPAATRPGRADPDATAKPRRSRLAKPAVRSSKLAVKANELRVSVGCGDGIGPCSGMRPRAHDLERSSLGKASDRSFLTKAVLLGPDHRHADRSASR